MLVSNVRSIIVRLFKDWNVIFLFFFIYNFCLDVRTNALISTFISKGFFFLKLNSFFLFFFFILIFVLILKFLYKKSYSYNTEFLSFSYRYVYFTSTLIILFFNYLLSFLSYFLNSFLSYFLNSFFYNSLIELYKLLFSFTWFPVFRRLSYFGLFRANRQKWTEINNENINRLKY